MLEKLACVERKPARWFLVSINLCREKQRSFQDFLTIDTVMWFVSIFKEANCCHSNYVLFVFKPKLILYLNLCFNNFLECFLQHVLILQLKYSYYSLGRDSLLCSSLALDSPGVLKVSWCLSKLKVGWFSNICLRIL